jgi:hypothetical protein
MGEASVETGRPPSQYVGFKDRDKPMEVRSSNIVAAKGRDNICLYDEHA